MGTSSAFVTDSRIEPPEVSSDNSLSKPEDEQSYELPISGFSNIPDTKYLDLLGQSD